jgi:hypothetical protein
VVLGRAADLFDLVTADGERPAGDGGNTPESSIRAALPCLSATQQFQPDYHCSSQARNDTKKMSHLVTKKMSHEPSASIETSIWRLLNAAARSAFVIGGCAPIAPAGVCVGAHRHTPWERSLFGNAGRPPGLESRETRGLVRCRRPCRRRGCSWGGGPGSGGQAGCCWWRSETAPAGALLINRGLWRRPFREPMTLLRYRGIAVRLG